MAFAWGMQTACIEFARNVCGLKEANSSEFNPASPHRIIYKLRELLGVEEMGGTMRLGRVGLHSARGFAGIQGVWDYRDQRAAPASVRVQPRVRSAVDRRRAETDRYHSGRDVCGNCGAA